MAEIFADDRFSQMAGVPVDGQVSLEMASISADNRCLQMAGVCADGTVNKSCHEMRASENEVQIG